MSKNFALIGCAGYIAPRHIKAIVDTNNNLVAALDPHDSVGILDRFSNDVQFFKEYERFDRYLEKMKRQAENKCVHYISICSPNYLHDAHIRTALRTGANAICEKPLVLNPRNLDALKLLEEESNKKVYTILQLRSHPSIIKLKNKISNSNSNKKFDVELTYITFRGPWYNYSWKGDVNKSGGLLSNIGIHFFDMLIWVFGKVQHSEIHYKTHTQIGGFLELKNAKVKWFLSIDKNDILEFVGDNKLKTYRSIICNGEQMQFSDGFTDLHTLVYKNILEGHSCGIEESRPSIQLVYELRNKDFIKTHNNIHPIVKQLN